MKNNIKLIVYDFDGVMTDNRVFVNQDGREMVCVSRADGLAVERIKKLGINQLIITTENNPIVSMRAKKLGIPIYDGVMNKKNKLILYCKENNFDLKDVIFVGNDINDKEAMKAIGYSICPNDSHVDIKKISKIIMKTDGGDGVVRELYDLLIKGNSFSTKLYDAL